MSVYLPYILQGVVPFGAYFAGIVIRNIALPGRNSPPLLHQLLLGIPVSLIVVSPLLGLLQQTDPKTFLVSLGIIVEHGMVVHETITGHLRRLVKPAAPARRGGV